MKNYLAYYNKFFSQIYITEDVLNIPCIERVREKLSNLPVYTIKKKEEIPAYHSNKHTLFITSPKGHIVSRCPGSKGHICCNYLTVDLYLGCPLGCSYCIMKSYLNFRPLTVYVDINPGIKEIRRISQNNQDKIIRIGTGEVGDSLALDPIFELSREYIEALSDLPNVYFELKTKTHLVDHILNIKQKGNAVIGFSLNPQIIIDSEEGSSSSLKLRISAAKKAVDAGYNVAFHFDPIFKPDNLLSLYRPVIKELNKFPSQKIAWISLGTFRYPSSLKDKIDQRPYLYEEFIRCKDEKYRYIQRVRKVIYKTMLDLIRSYTSAPVYMCMESSTIWEQVFNSIPQNIPELQTIFNNAKDVAK